MSVKNIDVKQANELQTTESYTYIDVRSVPEFESGHAAGAHNVPLLHRELSTGQMQPNTEFLAVIQANYPADSRLLIGCQMGGRSAKAAEILLSAGYTDVSNVLGGFGGHRDSFSGHVINQGWADAGLPVETESTPKGSYADLSRNSGT